jgi:hypothetical protein
MMPMALQDLITSKQCLHMQLLLLPFYHVDERIKGSFSVAYVFSALRATRPIVQLLLPT